jgi:enolase
MQIEEIVAEKILSSSGKFTIQVELKANGIFVKASVPSGISLGKYEVSTFSWRGIDFSIDALNRRVAQRLRGFRIDSLEDLFEIEKLLCKLDGTKRLRNIGGNSLLALLFACLRLIARRRRIPVWKVLNPRARLVPKPLSNVLGGGAHGDPTSPDIQEFLLFPERAKSFEEGVKLNRKAYLLLGKRLRRYGTLRRNIEGAWLARVDNLKALGLVSEVADELGLRVGIDVAASHFYDEGKGIYLYKNPIQKRELSRGEQIDLMIRLARDYGLFYLEDPLEEKDFDGFAEIRRKSKCLVVGDDLLVTNPRRLIKGIKKRACDGAVLKPNQVCLLSKAIEFLRIAKKNKIEVIISHRSGETSDEILADLAFAWEVPIIKISLWGKERIAKIKRLIQIERSML